MWRFEIQYNLALNIARNQHLLLSSFHTLLYMSMNSWTKLKKKKTRKKKNKQTKNQAIKYNRSGNFFVHIVS